jgi:hypothetical protein
VHLFAAVHPATGARFALVMPEVSTEAMNLFLAALSKHLAADEHALRGDNQDRHVSGTCVLMPVCPSPATSLPTTSIA